MRLGRENSVIVERIAAWLSLAIVVIAIALASLATGPAPVYGGTTNGATTVTATVSAAIDSNKVVTISGVLSSGAGQPVSVMITDPNGMLEYVSNTTTASGGSYSFSYTMSNTATGAYNVTVGAPGLTGPVTTSFVYNTVPVINATVSAAIDSNKVVTVSGAVGSTGGQPVSVMITDPNGMLEYVSNTTTASGGSYSFSYTMSNTATGAYNVTVGAPALTGPVTTSFVYNTVPVINATVSAAIDSNKVVTVSGAVGSTGGQPVSVMITDPNGMLEYVSNTTTAAGGAFSFSYTMSNTAQGTYLVIVGSPQLTAPLTTSFVYLPGSADLKSLAISSGSLAPAFAPGTTAYTVNVAYDVSSETVTPTAADPKAVIKVNGAVVASGTASGPIALSTGSNTITAAVTASDGTTTKAYTITITRAGTSSGGGGGSRPTPVTYTVTYNANNANATGKVPVDSNRYQAGATVTVPGNTGRPALALTGYTFGGWSMTGGMNNGSGTLYGPNATLTFTMPANSVTLYAVWTAVAPVTYTVTYNANNANATGKVPVDSNRYQAGATVTVPGNTGRPALALTGYTFGGWSMTGGMNNGSGTVYGPNATLTFTMPANSVTLYAVWTAAWLEVGDLAAAGGANAAVVNSVYSVGGSIYAGTNDGVWVWNGSGWSEVGDLATADQTGAAACVNSLVSVGDSVYAGTKDGVWAWNGFGWTDAGYLEEDDQSGAAAYVHNLVSVSKSVYAGTNNRVWFWDGRGAWTQMPGFSDVFNPSEVYSLANVDGVLYAGTTCGSVDLGQL